MVRLFALAGEQAGTGRDIRPVFESSEHYMFGTQQAVFSVTENQIAQTNSRKVVSPLPLNSDLAVSYITILR